MQRMTFSAAVLVAGTAFLSQFAMAADPTMLTGANDMTLYTFDQDIGGVPSCYDDCATKWPPYLVATASEDKGTGWTAVDRKDGSRQWAYNGKPVYYFADDDKAGDKLGDNMNGLWHIIVQ